MKLNLRVFVLTFGILALELALIRWTAGQVRVFAYFGNLVLIVVFLGLGIGTGLGGRRSSLLGWAFPALAILCLVLAFAPQLGITQMHFPDPSVSLWGAEEQASDPGRVAGNLAIFIALISAITAVFVFIGTELGVLFRRAGERSVDAYAADLAGSLAGVLCFAALTVLDMSPPAWLALGVAPLVALRPRWWAGACALVVVACGYASVQGAYFSPYNRIDVSSQPGSAGIDVNVNRDFHQTLWPLDDDTMEGSEEYPLLRALYDLPFAINDRRGTAVIVGAGTGNDASGALRSGYGRVMAVEIDPVIIEIGRDMHPDEPYAKGGAEPIIDDARAFFRRYDGPKFDAVVYGLLDSHAMTSAMSSIRLDNFVYTVEGLREAWQHVSDDGHLVVGFSVLAGEWLARRIHALIYEATGIAPVSFFHGMHYGATFIVSRNAAVMDRDRIQAAMGSHRLTWVSFDTGRTGERVPSDDWPYLYVRPGVFPWMYLLIVGLVLCAAMVSIPLAYGRRSLSGGFDAPMFFVGAAFLLLETRGVTALSLLYGSTWIVNVFVFAGILFMALIATLFVRRRPIGNPAAWFGALIVITLALWQFDLSMLNTLPLAARGVVGGLVHAAPVFFAAFLFPLLLRRSRDPARALGSNLLGAVFGGCFEFSSMLIGLEALVAIAAAFYLVALLTYQRGEQEAISSPAPSVQR